MTDRHPAPSTGDADAPQADAIAERASLRARLQCATPPAASPMRTPSLFYAPPYDRTVEDELAWHLVKYLQPECGLVSQHRVVTPAGPSWVDVVIERVTVTGRVERIGIEISTEAEATEAHIPLRDAVVVGVGALDALYRVPESAVLYRLHDVLAAVAACEYDLFTARALAMLEKLADPAILDVTVAPAQRTIEVPRVIADEDSALWGGPVLGPEGFTVTRLVGREPLTWLHDYTRALDRLGRSEVSNA